MSKQITLEQLTAFNAELAALVRAGVPMESQLTLLASEGRGSDSSLIGRIGDALERGESLEQAIASEGDLLPPIYHAVVTAGLKSGDLATALDSLIDMSMELKLTRQRVGQALVQPVMLMMMAYFLFMVFGNELLQRYRETYITFRIQPGWLVGTLFTTTSWLREFWWIPPAGLVAALIWWAGTARSGLLQLTGFALPLRIVPWLNHLVNLLRFASFTRLLSLLCQHGVPLPESLRLAGASVGPDSFRHDVNQLAASVELGTKPPETKQIPSFIRWALTAHSSNSAAGTAANANALPRILNHAATIYSRRAETVSIWMKHGLPIVATMVFGSSILLAFAFLELGPMIVFWWEMVESSQK